MFTQQFVACRSLLILRLFLSTTASILSWNFVVVVVGDNSLVPIFTSSTYQILESFDHALYIMRSIDCEATHCINNAEWSLGSIIAFILHFFAVTQIFATIFWWYEYVVYLI